MLPLASTVKTSVPDDWSWMSLPLPVLLMWMLLLLELTTI
jgi:hypothetical protein